MTMSLKLTTEQRYFLNRFIVSPFMKLDYIPSINGTSLNIEGTLKEIQLNTEPVNMYTIAGWMTTSVSDWIDEVLVNDEYYTEDRGWLNGLTYIWPYRNVLK